MAHGRGRSREEFSIREEPVSDLSAYATVPIGFEARSRLDLAALEDLKGFRLVEIPIPPRRKEYDALESPLEWPRRFDVSNWVALTAWDGDRRIGGAIVARDAPGVDLLEGRRDLAVVWDLRVIPEWRGRGVGQTLFKAAQDGARARGCRELRVETQDLNVAACRFYAGQGCRPVRIVPDAYPGLDEVMILWGMPL